jgi:hypothetical protein
VDGLVLPGAERRLTGGAAPAPRTIAAWDDGRSAAAARAFGEGCLVRIGTDPEGGQLPLSADFPGALDALLRGCRTHPGNAGAAARVAGMGALPLDRGAIAVLRGGDLPDAVPTAAVAGLTAGSDLARPLLLALVGLAMLEAVAAHLARRSR